MKAQLSDEFKELYKDKEVDTLTIGTTFIWLEFKDGEMLQYYLDDVR